MGREALAGTQGLPPYATLHTHASSPPLAARMAALCEAASSPPDRPHLAQALKQVAPAQANRGAEQAAEVAPAKAAAKGAAPAAAPAVAPLRSLTVFHSGGLTEEIAELIKAEAAAASPAASVRLLAMAKFKPWLAELDAAAAAAPQHAVFLCQTVESEHAEAGRGPSGEADSPHPLGRERAAARGGGPVRALPAAADARRRHVGGQAALRRPRARGDSDRLLDAGNDERS